MEIKQRMSKRFAWLLGVVVLVSIGLLVACGTKYSASSDGLVLVGSQGSAVIQTFSFNLGSGHISGISNPPTTPGSPSAMVLDPAGAYAYVIVGSSIAAYKVNSNGTLTAVGSPVADVTPVALFMDAAGKFLFVAEGLNSIPQAPNSEPCPGSPLYGVCVYAIGSGASLTAVPGTFTFNLPPGLQAPNFAALAATPTVFPSLGLNGVQNAVCSGAGNNPPTSEFLYVADSVNNVVWEFGVDLSSGALENPPGQTEVKSIPAQSVPSGVAVDPCNRFVYVANNLSNNVNAYTICSAVLLPSCPAADGTLVPVSGSPFSISGGANGPGPLVVDPFGNTLYVVDTDSSMLSVFRISPVSGSLTPGNPAVVATGAKPTSIAIRSDDSWLFVTNFTGATLSQYSITPATGSLSPQPAITTDNYPWGVAVK